MRLWHQDLIKYLPRQQLLGQHRECCALRGKGWGKKHSTVDYVFKHSRERLVGYHLLVIREMNKRGYKTDHNWSKKNYRGKNCPITDAFVQTQYLTGDMCTIYPEHDDDYYNACLDNLKNKGIDLGLERR